mmetsp:Transcript_10988/g.32540  ORF Transcript_10988/g.32540 Transcript_10988/m.32540 type:complete len:222 (+) Transcript_10988:235-900(+)
MPSNHIPRRNFPAPIASAAPISVFMKLTTSFVIHRKPSFSCKVAPIRLSALVAKNAATVATATPGTSMRSTAKPYNASASPPTAAAAVPSAETAPSVPGSTLSKVVMRKAVLPYALPISDAKVSASLVARDATYPRTKRSEEIPRKESPCTEAAAQTRPVRAEPHTFSGPLRPPRPSAIPAFCFSSNFTFVTAWPKNRYSTQSDHPLHPNVVQSNVPKATE